MTTKEIAQEEVNNYCIEYADIIRAKEEEFIRTLQSSVTRGEIGITFAYGCLARTRISLLTTNI